MLQQNKFSLVNTFIVIFGALALFYVFYKGATNSFTHDESYTYTRYVYKSTWDIITYNASDVIPNNHILNTLLMKLFQFFFGSSELVLRLPNMLAYVAFLVFSIRWLKKMNNDWLLVIGLIALHANPYLLDFFALARGYGLSISFMFISFYFFYNFISSAREKELWLSFLFAALAVCSSFILLNYYIALLVVYNIFCLLKLIKTRQSLGDKVKAILIGNKYPLLITGILVAVIFKSLITISGDLFGPSAGFWTNTARSLIYCSTYRKLGDAVDYLSIFAAIVLIASAVLYIYDLYKSGFNINASPHLVILLLVVIPACMTILQHVLLKVPYLENRTGLFFAVLFHIGFVYLLYFLVSKYKFFFLPILAGTSYAGILLYIFIHGYSLSYYSDWDYDSKTKEVLKMLEEEHHRVPPGSEKTRLGITWIFEPGINFYRQTKKLDWLAEVNRDGYQGEFDYYYVQNDSVFIHSGDRIILKDYAAIQCVLAKHR